MEGENVGGGAAPAGGGGGSAPPAAPTSSATPTAPSSAPSSSAVSTDIAAETGSTPIDGESSVQTLSRVMQEKAKPVDPPAEDPAQPVDQPNTDPAPPDPQQPVDDKAAQPQDAVEEDEEEPFTLDDAPEPTLPPREINKLLAAAPALKAELDKNPQLKNAFYENARVATKARDIMAIIPDKETAQSVVQSADEFAELSGLFLGATDTNKTKQFLGRLQEYDTMRGEDGKPLVDAQGRPQSSGAVGRFLDFTLDTALEYWKAQADTLKAKQGATDEELAQADGITDAIETFQTVRGRGTRSAAKEDVPEHIRQREADINSREESLRRQESERAAATEQTFEDGVQTGIKTTLQSTIKSYLDQCDLQGRDPELIAKEIESGVYGKLKDSRRFTAERDRMMLNPMNDKTKRDRIALAMRWAKPLVRDVAREQLKAAGARMKAKQDAVRQKADTGRQESRSEPRSGGAPPAPGGPMTTEQLMDKAKEEVIAGGGNPNNTAEILQKYVEVKQRLGVR